MRSDSEFLSASEDGTVRLWDLRIPNVVHTLRICDEAQLKRPGCGKGVCALDVQGSFMVSIQIFVEIIFVYENQYFRIFKFYFATNFFGCFLITSMVVFFCEA